MTSKVARIFGFCLLAVVLLGTKGARAADCSAAPLGEFASLDMTPLPNGGGMSVPVSINGVPKNFLVATAAGASTLTQKSGEALGLSRRYTNGSRLLDVNGFASYHYFKVDAVQIGVLHGEDLQFFVTPDPTLGQDAPLDGVLAPDIMGNYDIEIDFAKRKLNFFSPKHCPGQVVYWPSTAVGVAPITLVMRAQDLARRDHGGEKVGPTIGSLDQFESQGISPFPPSLQGIDIRTTVILDGKSFTANIDTGSATSTLNTNTARAAYGVVEDSPGSMPVKTQANNQNPGVSEIVVVNGIHVFEHTFHTLTLGNITVTNPHFTVRPDATGSRDPNNGFMTGGNIFREDDFPRPEITIGMDILSQLHLYFAFKEGKLYITPADPAPASHS